MYKTGCVFFCKRVVKVGTEEEAAVETMTEAMTDVPQTPVPVDREAFRSRVLDNITDQSYLNLYNVWMQRIQ